MQKIYFASIKYIKILWLMTGGGDVFIQFSKVPQKLRYTLIKNLNFIDLE